MGSFSIAHWLIFLGALFLVVFPVTRILRKAGLSPWWAALAVLPPLYVPALWLFAFARWPAVDQP